MTEDARADAVRRNATAWEGRELLDRLGHCVGRIEKVHGDPETGGPMWAAVQIGLFATRRALVPMVGARVLGERVGVPVDKQHILRAPRINRGGKIARGTEAALYRHYRLERSQPRSAPGEREPGAQPEDAMTRSEEELKVGTARRRRGRVKVRKYVVTEQVERTIPVRREEIRVEREPPADDEPDSEQELDVVSDEEEIILHEEVPVIEKRVVPRQRVRVEKGTRVDRAEVKEQVRRERIEAEGDLDP